MCALCKAKKYFVLIMICAQFMRHLSKTPTFFRSPSYSRCIRDCTLPSFTANSSGNQPYQVSVSNHSSLIQKAIFYPTMCVTSLSVHFVLFISFTARMAPVFMLNKLCAFRYERLQLTCSFLFEAFIVRACVVVLCFFFSISSPSRGCSSACSSLSFLACFNAIL